MHPTTTLGLLFDMDGVVCHNMPAHETAWRLFFHERGIEIDLQDFRENTMGMPTREVLRYYFKREVEPAEAAALAAIKETCYRQLYLPERRPAKGLVDFLSAARAQGHRLGLGTGSLEDNISFILDGLDLRRRFDAVIDGGQVTRGKPDPETFLKLAAKLGVAPAGCIVFEDSLLGEEAAGRAGMAVVAVTTSHHADEFRRAALAVRDFAGLTPSRVAEVIRSSSAGIKPGARRSRPIE